MNIEVLGAALVIGVLGAGHCVGMCGGIIGALSFAIDKHAPIKRTSILFAYSFGRVLSYTLLGAAAAGVAQIMEQMGFTFFRIIAGVLMILMGAYLSGLWNVLTVLEKAGAIVWRYIQPIGNRLLPVRSKSKAVLLGVLWGWLPCGLVYTALAFSATEADPVRGAAVMLAFGVGTLPAVLAGGLTAVTVGRIMQGRNFRFSSAVLLVIFGLWTLYGSVTHFGHSAGNHSHDSHHHTE